MFMKSTGKRLTDFLKSISSERHHAGARAAESYAQQFRYARRG